jgi:hypothetical protein
MKKNLKPFVFFGIILFSMLNYSAYSQDCNPPNKNIELGANNIRAIFKTDGAHFFKSTMAEFEVPKGSGKNTFFAASLWLGGKDEQGNLHLAAMKYGQRGNDYWTGPVSSAGAAAGTYYDKFWKLTKTQVEDHKLNYETEGYEVPDAIAHWPAHGRAEYEESAKLAPYESVSGNSSYTPDLGDYPLIRGDEAIFWIHNDICDVHGESGGEPLGVEILSMAYAYDTQDEVLQNTIFVSYVIRNKSKNSYKDFYVGFFADFDIGYAYDDYIGCDPLLNLAYGYNGQEIDGSGQHGTYDTLPPAQGAMFLNQNMSAFMHFNNSSGVIGDPREAMDYYHFLQAKWRDGTPLTLWGDGYNPESTDYTNFAYSGDPVMKTGWTEFTTDDSGSASPHHPGDRRGVMSAGPFTLPAGKSICIDIALPFAQGEDYLASVELLKQHAQTIQQFYNSQNYEDGCAESFGINEVYHAKVQIYPNPSNGRFVVSCDKIIKTIELYDVLGKKVFSDAPKVQTTQINTGLPQGLYIYRLVLQDNSIRSGKIVVQ